MVGITKEIESQEEEPENDLILCLFNIQILSVVQLLIFGNKTWSIDKSIVNMKWFNCIWIFLFFNGRILNESVKKKKLQTYLQELD